MRKVVIMSGCAGSGKSKFVEQIVQGHIQPNVPLRHFVCSADNFFFDETGNYVFDASKLSEAHGWCFRNFIEEMRYGCDHFRSTDHLIIVDNTNTTTEEVAPYILGASAYGYEPEIIQFSVPNPSSVDFVNYVERCATRNKHGVSYSAVASQCRRLIDFNPMPWWKLTVVQSQF